jgi:hypothetical protein
VLTVTVLGGIAPARDKLAAALATQLTHLGISHHITTALRGDLTLLLGMRRLDALPGGASDLADQAIRNQLHDARQPYQVLYGAPDEQLAQALRLIRLHQQRSSPARVEDALPPPDPPSIAKPWRWACDKCSDPGCEHKLLTDLLAQRAKPG